MSTLYVLIIDTNDGNNEDFNLNYLDKENCEVYLTEQARTDRIGELDKLFELVKGADEGQKFDTMCLDVEFDLTSTYPKVPAVISEWASDNEYEASFKDGEFVLVDKTDDSSAAPTVQVNALSLGGLLSTL